MYNRIATPSVLDHFGRKMKTEVIKVQTDFIHRGSWQGPNSSFWTNEKQNLWTAQLEHERESHWVVAINTANRRKRGLLSEGAVFYVPANTV